MKGIIGFLLIGAGIAFGLWAGVWWAFIGGIIQVVEGFKADPTSAKDIALGIGRVFFAGAIGWLAAIIAIIPGVVIINK